MSRMLVFLRFQLLFATSICFATSATEHWQQFRQTFPYHIQTLALSDPEANGHRTLVISEPPPTVTLEDIQNVDRESLATVVVRDQGIGVDGWMRDVVVDLPPMDERRLATLVDKLNLKLFGTTYKAFAIRMPSGPAGTRSTPAALNLHVTAGNLQSWILGDVKNNSRDRSNGGAWFPVVLVVICGIIAYAKLNAKKFVVAALFGCISLVVALYNFPWALTLIATAALALFAVVSAVRGKQWRRAAMFAIPGVILAMILGTHWFERGPSTRFHRVLGGPEVTCRSILDHGTSGVYVSTNPGLVLWAFPRNADLDQYKLEARQFALDSDLLVGGIASDEEVAIIGRERTVPVADLPPLRTETIIQLASAQEDELGQSYERKNPFAGRFDRERSLDWAPIYLSARLIDTEYGSLLNITDQMLKSWSQHGDVKYINFRYPTPSTFPFTQPLSSELHAHEVVFNWNTKGAGYIVKRGSYELFALNRTGALPVDYLANGKPAVQSAEDTAYDYFAKLNDPNLVRVVQYAGLYQLFHHFGVRATGPQVPEKPASPLVGPAKALVSEIAKMPLSEISRFEMQAHGPDAQRAMEFAKLMRSVRRALVAVERDPSASELRDKVANAMVDREALVHLVNSSDETDRVLAGLASEVQEIADYFVDYQSRAYLKLLYSVLSYRKSDHWIHTPSVVVSRGTPNLVGGHNLYSKVTVYEADSSVEAGHVRVIEENGKHRVLYNPADNDRIGETVRSDARAENKSSTEIAENIDARLRQVKSKPVTLDEGLGFDGAAYPDKLRGLQKAHVTRAVDQTGWEVVATSTPNRESTILAKLVTPKSHGVVIERNGSEYVLSADSAGQIRASDLPSLTDGLIASMKLSAKDQVNVHFIGFEPEQAEGVLRSIEFNYGERKPIVATLDESFNLEERAAVLKDAYKLEDAKVRGVTPAEMEGRLVKAVDVEVEVPARTGLRGLLLRIRVRFAKAVENSAVFMSSIKSQIAEIFGRISSEHDLSIALGTLVKELRTEGNHAGVSIHVSREGKDLFFVREFGFAIGEEPSFAS